MRETPWGFGLLRRPKAKNWLVIEAARWAPSSANEQPWRFTVADRFVNPEAFQACFSEWLTALRETAAKRTENERPTLAVDGKTLRRSHDQSRNLGALHSVSVWASEYGLTLAQAQAAITQIETTTAQVQDVVSLMSDFLSGTDPQRGIVR